MAIIVDRVTYELSEDGTFYRMTEIDLVKHTIWELPADLIDITIQSEIDGIPVKELGLPNSTTPIKRITSGSSTYSINDLIIPDSVEVINSYAFKGHYFNSVIWGNSIKTIHERAFYDCRLVRGGKASNPIDFILPKSLEYIGNYAFYKARWSTYNGTYYKDGIYKLLDLSDSNIKYIGNYAFYSVFVKEIKMPSIIEFWGTHSFAYNNFLLSIELPLNVDYIPRGCFSNSFADGSTFTIPRHIKHIDVEAFSSANFAKVELHPQIETIGNYAFEWTNIEELEIPITFKSISRYAFSGCNKLKSVIIPVSLTTVEMNAFNYCTALTDVYYEGSEKQWNQIVIKANNDPLLNAKIHFKEKTVIFAPSSTIHLCNVPFDNTNKHQILFTSQSEQYEYFYKRVQRTFSDYLVVRKTLPNGSLESRVKVNANIESLANVNYMFYQNLNHGSKWFYAFITKLIYINEGTTEIVFETDVFQTWFLDVEIKESYVVREHSETDEIGDNVTPEKFVFEDFNYSLIRSEEFKWGYVVATSTPDKAGRARGCLHSGIYQGLYFYYFTDPIIMNTFLDDIEEKKEDTVVFISLVPNFCVSGDIETLYDEAPGQGYVKKSDNPHWSSFPLVLSAFAFTFDGYEPKNNKLFTSPYCNIVVSNHTGQEAVYNREDFANPNMPVFDVHGDLSANPTLMLVPENYKGVSANYDAGMTLGGFPQCSFNSDTYKLWLAKNQFGLTTGVIANTAQIIGGALMSATAVGAPFGVSMIASGISGIANTIGSITSASHEPNRSNSGTPRNNLVTAMGINRFDYYMRMIKRDYAETLDNFFTMFGYQTNKLKTPNLSSRPYFNYVETIDINIIGGIPADDMFKLKNVFNGGVTLWKPTATMLDYSVDNSPAT